MLITRGLRSALLIKHIERVADALMEIADTDRRRIEQRHVVQLDRIWDAVEPVVHAVRQVVIDPVAGVFDAMLAQKIERVPGLGQARSEPAPHGLPILRNDRAGGRNLGILLGFGHPGQHDRIGQAVPHELPLQPNALFHDTRIEFSNLAVERDSSAHAMLAQHLHHAPDADAIAVVAPGVIADVRRTGSEFEMEVLDVGDDPDCDTRAIRPLKWRMIDERTVWKGLERVRRFHDAIRLVSGAESRDSFGMMSSMKVRRALSIG